MTDVYRDGRVHVQRRQCSTCIFRPGNLMHLVNGRVEQMVEEATRTGGCIPCHKNLEGRGQAVCRGFYDLQSTDAMVLAGPVGIIEWVTLREDWSQQ